MSYVLKIKRGSTVIANGVDAMVDGCPLASCERLIDFVQLIKGAGTLAFDRTTVETKLTFSISRSFDTIARTFDHNFRAPQTVAGVQDLVIEWSDGIDTHTWTLEDAGWPSVTSEKMEGVRVLTTYEVTGGLFTYDGSLPDTYTDAL